MTPDWEQVEAAHREGAEEVIVDRPADPAVDVGVQLVSQ